MITYAEQHFLRLFLVYGLIGFFLLIERFLRHGENAKTLKTRPEDRGSTLFIGLGFGASIVALVAAAFLDENILVAMPSWLGWGGLAVMVLGLIIRIWSTQTLGKFYTRTLITQAHQTLVESGPYRWLRHPGYLGVLMFWLGAGVASGNIIALVIIALMLLPAYIYRIHSEEAMLRERFGVSFDQYAQKRWRVIPFLY
jgi:protein-S-isoprenylcysteine O-methyltransferase Ste14